MTDRRRILAACALAGIAILLAGCGRESVVAPQAPTPERFEEPRMVFGAQGSGTTPVVAFVLPGTDLQQLAVQYGATVGTQVSMNGWECAQFYPEGTQSALSLAAIMHDDPRVLTAEKDVALEPAESRQQSFSFDDGSGTPQAYQGQASVDAVGLAQAHPISRGRGVLVAILDTGVDLTHPALAGRIAGGWDFIDGDAIPADVANGLDDDGDGFADEALGHGTHVAGIVALVAPEAELLIVRVLDADGRGDLQTVAVGIRWAVSQGARVLNMSLGALVQSEAIQYLLEDAEYNGVVSVAAAGNWGAEDPEEYPAESSHALAIAAVTDSRNPASFSSYGSHIFLSAPGVDIRSAFVGGNYALWSGTSMAVPFVAGTAALLLARHPYWSQADVEMRLEQTAAPIIDGPQGIADRFGAGALDAGAALLPSASGGEAGDPLKRR